MLSLIEALTVSSADARTVVRFVPEANLVCSSLVHDGVERLDSRRGLDAYAERGKTMGIPLLHPWANRLSGFDYSAAGRSVTLSPEDPRLPHDPNGLPIHGVLPSLLVWDAAEPAPGTPLRASLRWESEELLELFPFPHRLEVEAAVRTGTLTLQTELVASRDGPVPAAFGYHPYLRLCDLPRERWEVTLAARERLLLDERQIPTGERVPLAEGRFLLAEQDFDDALAGLPRRPAFVAEGGEERVVVTFEEGYRFAQIYAPHEQSFVCFEPMSAATDALRSGRGLTVVPPGCRYRTRFSVSL